MSFYSFPKIWISLSFLNGSLVLLASLLGVLNPLTYAKETTNWARQAIGQDFANLVVVLLLFICTFYLTKRSVRAFLIWVGLHIYLIYAYVIYSFSVHFNYLFLVYVAVLGLSFYLLVRSFFSINYELLPKTFNKKISVKPISVLLMLIGALFGVLWLMEIIPYIFSNQTPQSLVETGLWVNPVHVLDLGLLLPGMVIISVQLWKKNMNGYLFAVPLLVFSATMGLGILSLFTLLVVIEKAAIAPPAYVIAIIVSLSTYFTYKFLKQMKEP